MDKKLVNELLKLNSFETMSKEEKDKLYRKYIGVAYDVLEWLKRTPILINMPWAELSINFEYKKSVTSRTMGGNFMLGSVILNISNIIFSAIDLVNAGIPIKYQKNAKIKNKIIDHIIIDDIVHTVIHESIHMHYNGDISRYKKDPQYHRSLEDRIEYTTFNFIKNNIESIRTLVKCEVWFDDDLEKKIKAIVDRNDIIKEVELNDPMTMVGKVVRGTSLTNTKILETINEKLYDPKCKYVGLKIVDPLNLVKYQEIIKHNQCIDYAALNKYASIILERRAHGIKIFCSKDKEALIIQLELRKETPIFKPVLKQIMVKIPEERKR